VDRPALGVRRRGRLLVDRLADHIPDAAERDVSDRNRDRPAGVLDGETTREPVGRIHRDRADAIVTEVLLHLCDDGA
jgi:peptide chain release factor 1